MELTMVVTCPVCRGKFKAFLRLRGRRAKCPHCGAVGIVASTASPRIRLMPLPQPGIWQADCETAVLMLSYLLRASGRQPSPGAVVELLRQLPRSPNASVPAHTLLARCICDARGNGWTYSDRKDFKDFVDWLCGTPPEHRALFEASVIGVLLGFGMSK